MESPQKVDEKKEEESVVGNSLSLLFFGNKVRFTIIVAAPYLGCVCCTC